MEALPFDFTSHVTWIRMCISAVWITFGLVFKLLGAVPRHRRIVARVVGEPRARAMTTLVGMGEVGLGLWMLYGRHLSWCAGIQTVALLTMNALEIRHARELLLSPVAMVIANVVLIGLCWYVALVS